MFDDNVVKMPPSTESFEPTPDKFYIRFEILLIKEDTELPPFPVRTSALLIKFVMEDVYLY